MSHVWKCTFIRHVSHIVLSRVDIGVVSLLELVILAVVHDDALGYFMFYLSYELGQLIIALKLFLRLDFGRSDRLIRDTVVLNHLTPMKNTHRAIMLVKII